MIEVSNTELLELKNSGSLVVGEKYHITNYGGNINIYMGAISSSEFDDESTSDNPNIYIHYLLEENSIDYMKDVERKIEGYFDWSNNISGEVKDIYFENSRDLKVLNSTDVYCSDSVVGSISNSTNIMMENGATVTIDNSQNIVVGEGTTVYISGCNNLTIGERNNLSIENIEGVSIADENENLKLNNYNIVWSGNFEINILGENNVIYNGNREVNLLGDFNEINESRYIELDGHFNKIENSELIGFRESVGNELLNSYSVDVIKSNNSSISTKNLVIEGKTPFVSYHSNKNSDVKVVKNLVQPIDLQSDNRGRVLDLNQQRFLGETGTDGIKNVNSFKLDNGIWVKKV